MSLQNIQFLDTNFATLTGTTIGSSTPPVSTLYGGQPGDPSSPLSSGSLASVSIPYRDGSTYSGAAQQFTITFQSAQQPANLIVTLDDPITIAHELVLIDAGPSAINTAKRYYAWPVNDRTYYVYVPKPSASTTWTLIFIGGLTAAVTMTDIFIGSSVAVDAPIASGLSHSIVDPSIITYADSGRAYAVKKTQYQTVSGLRLAYLDRHQVTALKTFSEAKGLTDPFWIAIDPDNKWDGPAFGMSFGAYVFSAMPTFTHDFLDRFTASFSLREAL